jgi:molybdopterin/thiamine biosynthesis adenylyltransferase
MWHRVSFREWGCILSPEDRVNVFADVATDAEVQSLPLVVRCASPKPAEDDERQRVEDRQAKVPGFSQEALSNLTVLLVGAGALGGEIAEGLVRKGVGTLKILDFDTVELSNLNRQFFFPEDVHDSKAWALARNLLPHGALGTQIIAWNESFENALEEGVDLSCGVVVSAVDDAQTRIAIAQFALANRVPAVFGGASMQADFARLFIQEVDGACFACFSEEDLDGGRTPCPGSPAIKCLFKTLAGLMLYAIDSLVMDRGRTWNVHNLSPSHPVMTCGGRVERRPECRICGRSSSESSSTEPPPRLS